MKRNDLQETLVSLYLRLNGYFTSGFIVHAPGLDHAGNRTQVDALAVRLPFNSEPERLVKASEYLQIPSGITDILICEVKGGAASMQFNPALRDRNVIQTVLRWVGAFSQKDIEDITQPVLEIMTPRADDKPDEFRVVMSPDSRYQVRAILFALDREAPRRNQTRYVHGAEIIGFINRCMRTNTRREQCTVEYDFGLWGGFYEPIIRLIKRSDHDLELDEVYNELKINDDSD